jgi:sulfur carrier protein ThiS
MEEKIDIAVEIHGELRKMALKIGSTVNSVLSALDLLPDAYIALRGKTPIPITEVLNPGDTIRLIRVASGG